MRRDRTFKGRKQRTEIQIEITVKILVNIEIL